MPHLHDLHCHVDLYPDPRELVDECEREGIYTVAVTNAPSVFPTCAAMVAGKRFVRAAIGLHPELVPQRHTELALIPNFLHETRYVGEVGLDYAAGDPAARALQRRVFAAILEACAPYGDRVVTVHSRRAADEVVEIIGAGFPGTVILHWFSGTATQLDRAAANGCYFSVNTAMLASDRGRRLVQRMPQDRVLLETDGPFVKIDGQPARPRDGGRTVMTLATLWQEEPAEVHASLQRTLRAAVTRRPTG